MQRNKARWLIVITIASLLLTGCWDMVEVEDRAFVLGMAIDRAVDDGQLVVTYQIALPGGGEDNGEEEGGLTLTVRGDDLFTINREVHTRVDRRMNFEHLQILLIGEEAGRQGVDEFFDFFTRYFHMRRRTRVLAVKGEARDILRASVKTQPTTAQYLVNVIENNEVMTGRITTVVDLGRMIERLRTETDFMLGCVHLEDGEVVVSGASIFQGFKLVGWLNNEETEGVQWMKGEIRYTVVAVDVPGDTPTRVICDMDNVHAKLTSFMGEERIDFVIEIFTEGDLAQVGRFNQVIYKEDVIRSIEKAIEDEIESLCRETLDTLQRRYQTDALDLSQYVRTRHHQFWEENKDQWTELFADAMIEVRVDANIRRVGLTR